jgi:hypothetical protein
MRNHKMLQRLCLVLLTVGLCGCVRSPEDVKSFTVRDVHAEIKRLMVVATVQQYKTAVAPRGIRASAFETAFRDSLGKCGVDVKFLFEDQLAVIADSEEAVRTFAPDALLAVEERRTDGERRYSANVIVMATKTLAWRAEIVFHEGMQLDETLPNTIVDRLKGDAVFGPSCANP